MVVLADEVLESFFETDLSQSFKLNPISDLDTPVQTGFLGDIWSSIATDSNRKIFNMFTDEIGKTIGKHQVSSLNVMTLWILPVTFFRLSTDHLLADIPSWKNRKPANRYSLQHYANRCRRQASTTPQACLHRHRHLVRL